MRVLLGLTEWSPDRQRRVRAEAWGLRAQPHTTGSLQPGGARHTPQLIDRFMAMATASAAGCQLERLLSASAASCASFVPARHLTRSCAGTHTRFFGSSQEIGKRAALSTTTHQRQCTMAAFSRMADGFDADYLPAHSSGEAWDVLGLGQVRLLPAGWASHVFARPFSITGTRPGGGSQHRCNFVVAGYGRLLSLRGRSVPATAGCRKGLPQVKLDWDCGSSWCNGCLGASST
jgi:hypothetical protein